MIKNKRATEFCQSRTFFWKNEHLKGCGKKIGAAKFCFEQQFYLKRRKRRNWLKFETFKEGSAADIRDLEPAVQEGKLIER